MKKITKKKMSIEDLAISMNKGFGRVNKKVDHVVDLVDKLAASTLKGFENVDKKIDIKVEELKSQIEGVDKRIDDFVATRVKYEDHNKLKARVNFVEKKLEIKN